MEEELKKAIKAYNKLAEIYFQYSYPKLQQYQMIKFISFLKGKKILDIGCGIGRDVEYFYKDGFDVHGIDISEGMIKEAKKHFPKCRFDVMDYRKLDFKEDSFNGIWGMASFQHVQRKEAVKVLKEFNKVLIKGGILYLAVYAGQGEIEEIEYIDVARKFYLYEKEEMEGYLKKAGFEILESDISETEEKNWLEIYARKK